MSELQKGIKGFLNKIVTYEVTEENARKALKEFREILIRNDVAVEVADYICNYVAKRAKGKRLKRFSDLKKAIRIPAKHAIKEILEKSTRIDLIELLETRKKNGNREPLITLFLGINGTGKTTTVAKVAYMLKQAHYRVVLAAADTYRSGAQEQLRVHAERLKIKLIQGKYGGDAAAVAFDAIEHAKSKYFDAVLIDTAGRMATNRDLMGEMQKIKRVALPDVTFLVVDALSGNDAAKQAQEFNEKVGIDGVILTKMDADARGGAALSISHVTGGKPICYVGIGQEYKDLEPFDVDVFVNKLFGLKIKKK